MMTTSSSTVTVGSLLWEADIHEKNGKRQEAARIREWVADFLSEQSKFVSPVWRWLHKPLRYATARSQTTPRASLLGTLLAVILLSLGVGPTAFAQDYQDWKFTHPKPQSNLLRKHQMIDASTWVAVGGNGTFMRTTDAGAT